MKLIESILTKNPCYTAGRRITVKGLMLHSVGCPDAGRFAHLHPDVGVVAAGPAMPAPVVPGEALVHGAIVAVNERMDAGHDRAEKGGDGE